MKSLSSSPRVDMGSGKVSSALIHLAVPSMISLFFQNLYSLIDTMFVSWLGPAPLAALSLSVPVFYLALALTKGIGMGTTTLMSSARGEGDSERADFLARYSLSLMFIVLCPLMIFVIPGPCRAIFSMLGAQGEVRIEVYDYALWLALSFPVMGYVMLSESVFMSHGDSFTPMKGMILGNIINLILDPVLIFWAGMGVGGASLASLLGWIFTGFYIRIKLARYGYTRPGLTLTKEMFSYWRAIWSIGYIITLSLMVITFSYGAMNWFLSKEGTAPIGAWNLMGRVELMITLPFTGISNALIPFVGFNFGKKAYGRILDAIKTSLFIEITGMVFFSILFILFSKDIMAVFRPGEEIIQYAAYALKVSAVAYVFFPFELTLQGTAPGLRRPGFGLSSLVFRQIILKITLAAVLSLFWGVKGIYWSHPISMAAGGLLSIVLMRMLLRKENILTSV